MAGALYLPKPPPIVAEQFLAALTTMQTTKMLSKSTDYTVSPAVVTGNMQSLTTSAAYAMHDTDWLVIGPNLEVVYTNARFTQLYTAAAGNTMTFSMGPLPNDPMTVQLLAYIAGAAGTLDIDWGDGTAHATPAVVVGQNTAITHTYTVENFYTVTVIYKVSGTAVSTVYGQFQAKKTPPPLNTVDLSTAAVPQPMSGNSNGVTTQQTDSGPAPVATAMNNPAYPRVVTAPEMLGMSGGPAPAGAGEGTVGTHTAEELEALESGQMVYDHRFDQPEQDAPSTPDPMPPMP